MPSVEARTATWLGHVVDLLSEPTAAMPIETVLDLLSRTFEVTGCSWNWFDPDGTFGMAMWPNDQMLFAEVETLELWLTGQWFDCHPLLTWYGLTGSIAPQTMARVPVGIVPARRRRFMDASLIRMSLEHQMTVIYRQQPGLQRAFVMARDRRDFTDDDLQVARSVQHALRCLDAQVNVMRRIVACTGSPAVQLEAGLTARELAVLQLIADGHSTRATARQLRCAPRTVEKHLERSYRKMGVRDRLNAVRLLRSIGVLAPVELDEIVIPARIRQYRGPIAMAT